MYYLALEGGGESGYGGVWACVGHDRQFAVAPAEVRADTLHLVGPNAWDGRTGSLSACDRLFHHTNHCIIRVDSISAPYAVASTDTLRVRFHGFVGRDGRWNLTSVEKQLRPEALEVVFRGEHHEDHTCTQMVVYLDQQEVVPPPLRTPFTIIAHEPDGSTIRRVAVAPT